MKLILRRKVQLEVKGDKVENRVLVSDICSLLYRFVFRLNVKIAGLDIYVNCLLTPFKGLLVSPDNIKLVYSSLKCFPL